MDSERPSPPTNEHHVERPFYLVGAMALLWIAGMYSLVLGGSIAMTLREGSIPDPFAVARENATDFHEALVPIFVAARLTALAAIPHLAFPLSVARALLACALVLASTLVLLGRPSARSFALQATFASAVFALIEYAALRSARGVWVDLGARAIATITDPALPPGFADMSRSFAYLGDRGRLVLVELGIPILVAIALTRKRTKTFFEQAAAAAESAEEEP